VIAGNTGSGVSLSGANTSGNVIQGNFIGLDRAGTVVLANGGDGVAVVNGASANTIGGTAPGAGNVISGNRSTGVLVLFGMLNQVQGNFIGTDITGTVALGKPGRRGGRRRQRPDRRHRRRGGEPHLG
jgi:titin